jgi:hypothetical protein
LALSGSDCIARTSPLLARIVAQLGGADMLMQRLAGSVFMLRVASALLAYVPQVLLARWMAGIYVYVWTWVLLPAGLLARAAIGLDRDTPTAVISAWFDHLARRPDLPRLLVMPYLPESGAVVQAFAAALAQRNGKR